jgi:glucose/arabinose dehydrogenase
MAGIFTTSASTITTKDPNLEVELVFDGLHRPTSMAFLGPNDILVTEKDEGTVQRILNGKMQREPLLDLHVANSAERGLLGLSITNETRSGITNKANGSFKANVFLFLSESSDKGDGTDVCDKNYCTSGDPVGHRLYRYELKGNEMINRQLLLNLPANPGADHLGGALVVGPDKNIYLTTGDGDSCEYDSCINGIEDSVINAQTANDENGDLSQGRGGILRVTQDGQVVNATGILGNGHPLGMYYAYGIRNSFGVDFDPVTGSLWDTENGPGFADEINLVEPGFNSGWHKAQGMWPITSYELLDPTPEKKGYFDGQQIFDDPDNLVDFNKRGKYSNPELSWNITRGITAIKFLNSDKLGNQYENDMFVGDYQGGLYHFDLNIARTQLELEDMLSDKVVNNEEEIMDAIFAEGFPPIVDIEVSPDGHLYVLSYDGSIRKVVARS